jgi:hypothetical protein
MSEWLTPEEDRIADQLIAARLAADPNLTEDDLRIVQGDDGALEAMTVGEIVSETIDRLVAKGDMVKNEDGTFSLSPHKLN